MPQTQSTTEVKNYLLTLQDDLCSQFEQEDGKAKFFEDKWNKDDGGGGGITRVLSNGNVFEGLGVNFSHVYGDALPPAASAIRPELAGRSFQAMGVSTVAHPSNPYAPTAHMNVRFFIAEKEGEDPIWWFGGGFDLTPYYPFIEDVIHWHQTSKAACDPFSPNGYAIHKKAADDYFFLKHRNETRGVGGLFFDDYNTGNFDKDFAFQRSVGDHYAKAYMPIINKRKGTSFSQEQRNFQLYRRGRYVEFNLLYDRGTHFGIQSGGRTESILMSLPPVVNWQYCYSPKPNTPEAELYNTYLKPQDWLNDYNA